MPRLASRLRLALVPAVLLLVAPAAGDRAVEASIRHLRSAVVPRRDGGHLVLLSSLRQLRDPTLRPLFFQLAQHEDPLVRIHAILGLAETDESGHVDTWLIRQLDAPEAQFAVITSALDSGLMDGTGIVELLGGEELAPRSRVLLWAALVARGEPVDRPALARLADNPSLTTAGLAAGVLAQVGDDKGAFASYGGRVAALSKSKRTEHLLEMFGLIRDYELSSVLEWVIEAIDDPDADPQLVANGIATALALDPARGVALWSRALEKDPPYSTRVRYTLLLLEAGPKVPVSAYDHLPAGDELIDRMVRAGKANSGSEDPAEPLIELLKLGHLNTSRWAMSVTEELNDEQAARVYLHLMDSVEGDANGREERVEWAITATGGLFKIDADAVAGRLAGAEDDGLTQQAILLGLLESRSPAAGEAARRVKRIGFGRADCMALILIAKHAAQLSNEESHDLGILASGGGRVSPLLQVQAAWLYLKHTARIEQALAEIFADADSQ
ncbi:MAG: hypothetical protein ACYS0G_12045 [Planctomycetota bacterium]|jgi:hypothetical protein